MPPIAALRELEKELRLSLLALGAVTGSGETPPSSSWVVEDGNGNSIANGAGGGDENKKTTGACDSGSDSRTASAGAGAGLLDDGFAVEHGLSCRADEDNDDVMEVVGEDLEDAVDLDSVGGALREVRLDA